MISGQDFQLRSSYITLHIVLLNIMRHHLLCRCQVSTLSHLHQFGQDLVHGPDVLGDSFEASYKDFTFIVFSILRI